MTKSALTTALNGFITSLVSVTKHRNANNAIVDEIYATPIETTQSDTAILTVIGSNFGYELLFTKTGRMVNVSGFIDNNALISLGGVKIANGYTITEFAPAQDIQFNNSKFRLTSNGLYLDGTMPSGTTENINISYPVIL